MKKSIITLVAAFAAVTLASAQTPLPNDPATKVGTLDNGLTYYIRHNDKPAQRAEFYLATHAGAILETPDQDGLAHFLEHMCFNGLDNLPGKQMLEYLQSIGASFGGNINASTGIEATRYMLNNIPVIREGILDTCLLVMHDYSHFVTNDPEEMDKERGVILEERRTRRTADWRMYMEQKEYLYKGSKYADCSLIGSEENLKTFKPESLVNFYHAWYRPDNQALIVVGDVDVDQVEAKIKTLFADVPKPEMPLEKPVITIPDNKEPIVGIITDPEATSSNALMVWKSQPIPRELRNTDIALVDGLMKAIVERVMTERFDEISSKPGAPFIGAGVGFEQLCETCDSFLAQVVFKDGEGISALKAMYTEVEKMKRFGFSESELQRAKDEILSVYEKAATGAATRKNAEFVGPLINNFFFNDSYLDPQTKYQYVQMILPQLPAQAINGALTQLITDDNLVITFQCPKKEGLAIPTEAELLAAYNEVKASEIEANAEEQIDSQFIDPSTLKGGKVKKTRELAHGVKEWTLSNGVKVAVLHTDYKDDQVLFQYYKDGGSSLISDEDLASFETNIWGLWQQNSGVSKYPVSTVNKMLSGKQVSISLDIAPRTNGVSGSCPPKDFETAMQLAYLQLTDARFDQDEYDVAISQIKALLPNIEKNPMFEFSKQLTRSISSKRLCGAILDEALLERASLQTIEKNYRKLFADAAGARMMIVGNVNPDEIKPIVEKYIGSLPKGKKPLTWKDNGHDYLPGNIINHFKYDMTTPKVTVAQIYNSYDLPFSIDNVVMLSAATYILRMIYTDTLREDEGGTYGASAASSFTNFPSQALIQVSFDTNPESADKLSKLAVDGLRKLAEEGPTDEQMGRTIEYYKKMLPENRITNNWWMKVISHAYRYDGADYDALYEQAVDKISADGIKKILSDVLASGNFAEIMMTPGETVE